MNQSIRKPRSKKQVGMRIHPPGKFATARLPFVGKDHGAYSNWDVPLTGNFIGGCEVGKAIAHIYLKYLRDERDNPVALGGSLLQSMLKSLLAKQPASKQEEEVLSGQIAGFAHELGEWLKGAACELGSSLDRCPEQTLVDRANRWLDQGVCDLVMRRIEQGDLA